MKNIQQDIKTGEFKQAYLLYGEETYLKQQYKNRLLKALQPEENPINFSFFEGKGIQLRELVDLCETMPFLAEHRVVLLENTGFFKNKCEELAGYMKILPDYLCLVFVETEVDKRSRMYKAVKAVGRVAEFVRQDEKTLARWAAGILGRENRRITQRDMELLLTMTGTDMGNLRMELEKLIAYTEGKNTVTAQDIQTICTTQTTSRIFEMVRAVTERKQKKALDLYYDLLAQKEPPMRILFLLARQYRQLLLTKKYLGAGASQAEAAKELGVQTFVMRGLAACAREYTEEELTETVRDCVNAEEAVKTGQMGDTLSVELLIVKFSSGRRDASMNGQSL
ncbi:MAG: DNA polymerase III subunit delta [Clostridiales bacterium]|nr:DNA polymerase III subunit delta [Clostridiales bacterium]